MPSVDFTAKFFGPSLMLLEDHITVHNQLFPAKTESSSALVHLTKANKAAANPPQSKHHYSKVLPIIQSSGFGKTRACVQPSTTSPGMLVCLREAADRTVHQQESFPLQDVLVYTYFEDCKTVLHGVDFPTTPDQHKHFNKAHLRVCAWLAVYCKTLAGYLEQLKSSAGCFSRQAAGSGSRNACHRYGRCWKTVVYHLAAAIHSPSSDFIPHPLFSEPELCPESKLQRLATEGKVATASPPMGVTSSSSSATQSAGVTSGSSSATHGAERENHALAPPLLFNNPNLRTKLLKYICDAAEDLYDHVCVQYSSVISEPELLREAIKVHLTAELDKLEACVPEGFRQPFFFLALDECGSMAALLPAIRRVWSHADPKCTWILLIDTNLHLAPLAGDTARKGSRRTDHGSTHRLPQPFSALPLDVNLDANTRQRIFADDKTFTLATLNQLLPKLGRPLWNDKRYHDEHGIIYPHLVIAKLVSPSDWEWNIYQEVPDKTIDNLNQNLLALASRRLNLDLTGRSSPILWYKFVSTQIAQHLRFVGRIFTSSDSIISNTPSEPPLSAAVAWFFRCEPENTLKKWEMVIQAIVNAIETVGFDVGAQGELGVALICSMAMDVVAAGKYADDLDSSFLNPSDVEGIYPALFGLVSVREWLEVLIGNRRYFDGAASSRERQEASPIQQGSDEENASDAVKQLEAWCDRAWLNFKHIVRLEEQLPIDELMDPNQLAELWVRQAAAQGISNQPGWDLLIPVYESSTPESVNNASEAFDKFKLSYIAVQVTNCIKFPASKLRTPVGPRLASSESKQCLELFIDLKGSARPEGPHLSHRRFPPPGSGSTERPAGADKSSQLLRHRLLIAGQNTETFPILGQLTSPASNQVGLLFGNADSRDTIDFDSARAVHVRTQDDAHQVAWDEAHVRMNGALVSMLPPSNSLGRKRKQRRYTRQNESAGLKDMELDSL